jgi:N6-L-threonylcarbamoyladenine synthase
MSNKDIYILGIESSCDDTSAAILKNDTVLSNKIANQSIHKKYGGVVPELASRAHLSNIIPVVELAIKESGISLNDISAIAFTRGPGLMGSLIVGTEFAKSLGVSLEVPVIEVNHMQAHILSNFIENGNKKPDFPFLGVTISGGHTQFILVEDYFKMKILGETLDDAIGEAFDKCGKKIGLGYPAGPEIDKLSKMGDENKFNFPLPKVEGGNISYSGTKTAFINFLHKNINKNKNFIDENLHDICASIQRNLVDNLLNKVKFLAKENNLNSIIFGGGVSANSYLKNRLDYESRENNWKIFIPELQYTTDNAAMIGIVGYLKYSTSEISDLKSTPLPRYSF